MSNLNLNTISSLDTGREVDVNRVMQTVDYVGGLVIDSRDTVIVDGDDRYVLAASSVLPYTTTGAGMPEGGAFQYVGDAKLRGDLVQPVATFDSVAGMVNAAGLTIGRKVRTLGYYAPGDGGGNEYEIVSAGTGVDDGGSFIDLAGSGLQAKGLFGSVVNVKQFGAVGDGVTDDLPALKAAIDFAPEDGMTFVFPNGHYYTPRAPVIEKESWLLVEKNNISLVAENKHGATLENIIILAQGAYGDKFRIGASLKAGDKSVSTASSHNFAPESYVQLLSSMSPYSPDAGDWQGGSTNPTSNTRPNCIFGETHKVSNVTSTTFEIYGEVIYPVYRPDNTGLAHPVEGLNGSYAREVFPVENFVVKGLRFIRGEGNASYRGIFFQRTVGGGVYECDFVTRDGKAGFFIRSEEAVNFTIKGCSEVRNPENAGGSSWNSFIIGGGSQRVIIEDNYFVGGQQIIDVTPLQDSVVLFGEERDHGPTEELYVTCHDISVMNNTIISGAGNAFTSHPANYKITLIANQIEGGGAGIGLRSRGNVVVGNNIRTQTVGIDLASFYDQTIISSNRIQQMPASSSTAWTGVAINPLSSETMNNNATDGFIVSGNLISAEPKSVPVIRGFHIRHSNDGEPNNPEFTEFTESIKTNRSNIVVSGNQFNNCGVMLERYVNGVSIIDNTFTGSIALNFVRLATQDCVGHTVTGNKFLGSSDESQPIRATSNTSITYPYSIYQNIYGNFHRGVYDEHTDAQYTSLSRERLLLRDGVSVEHGGSFQAVRNSGVTHLHLHGTPLDGTSRSIVYINYNSGTEDNRLYNSGLFVQGGSIWPEQDNSFVLGTGSARWAQIYAATGTINTSDEREKQQARTLTDNEQAVAAQLKGMIRAFKWNHAVDKKGENARWHFGVMAQTVQQVFSDHGLDAHDYGLFCYDQWEEEEEVIDEETGEVETPYLLAGERYGIRYDQLLAFIISAM